MLRLLFITYPKFQIGRTKIKYRPDIYTHILTAFYPSNCFYWLKAFYNKGEFDF